ncbi:MAG: HAMP domain-containing histidine kinase [Bacteroidaceae bacterium]|nr:HAMP domain-containing histidine kinase [Bacteroidaceae bacterium]
MKWFSNFRNVKIVLIVVAALIAATSLIVSNALVSDLKTEERKKMQVWADAMDYLNRADENTDLSLVLSVLNGNTTIPVVVTDKKGAISQHRNIEIPSDTDSLAVLMDVVARMRADGRIIRVDLGTGGEDYLEVCYSESLILKQLAYYPYVQLIVVLLFFVVCFFAILSSKRAEQNRVWVGLSKETAHQLGTPISSLMAWTTVLKEKYPSDELIPEMERDVARLQRVAERFSKIGSLPEPTSEDAVDVVERAVEYMKRRSPSQVTYTFDAPRRPLLVRMNAPLIEWVVENLCKNAVDAMNGAGAINISLKQGKDYIYLEVSDTGKGIPKSKHKQVFEPGYTTKKRGWGLGLSLAKRIVEEYHKGRIYVKKSAVGRGTTFCVELKK